MIAIVALLGLTLITIPLATMSDNGSSGKSGNSTSYTSPSNNSSYSSSKNEEKLRKYVKKNIEPADKKEFNNLVNNERIKLENEVKAKIDKTKRLQKLEQKNKKEERQRKLEEELMKKALEEKKADKKLEREVNAEIARLPKIYDGTQTHVPGSSKGIEINWQDLTQEEYVQFINLCATRDDFKTYASHLLVSLWENTSEKLKEAVHNTKIPNGIKTVVEAKRVWSAHLFSLIAEKFGLPKYNDIYLASEYSRLLNGKYNPSLFYICGYNDTHFKFLLNNSIYPNYFWDAQSSNPAFSNMKDFSLKEIVYKMIKGTLAFWNFKTNRKYADYTGKQPVKVNNGWLYCWFMGGFQLITSMVSNDDPKYLVNWNDFRQYLGDRYREALRENKISNKKNSQNKPFEGFELKHVISSYYMEKFKNQYPTSAELENLEASPNDIAIAKEREKYSVQNDVVEDVLSHLNSDHINIKLGGSSAENGIQTVLMLFPEIEQKKIKTKEILIEQEFDPILMCEKSNTGETFPAFVSVKNLIPGLNPSKPGIDNYYPELQSPNLYADYKLKWRDEPDASRLLVYELRGIGIIEQQTANKYMKHLIKNIGTGVVRPATHQRAIIKIDDSSWWHYCDSNMFYYSADSLQNLLNRDDTYMAYNYEGQTSPANFANTLIYSLISKEQWNRRRS